jgi:hypothetical protein
MKPFSPALHWLVPLIFILTLAAALAGLWPGEGAPYPLTNFRGEQVIINARGLYSWDTVSSAAQTQANDLVTLVLGLPLLAVSFWRARRGSLRGQLLLTGTLGFILYTYITMCFGAAYNPLFLVYVALFSLSLFAVILSMMSFDLQALPAHFSEKLPRRWIAGLLFFAAAFLSLAWGLNVAAMRPDMPDFMRQAIEFYAISKSAKSKMGKPMQCLIWEGTDFLFPLSFPRFLGERRGRGGMREGREASKKRNLFPLAI